MSKALDRFIAVGPWPERTACACSSRSFGARAGAGCLHAWPRRAALSALLFVTCPWWLLLGERQGRRGRDADR